MWGRGGGADLQAVALVFVVEEAGADEGDVVGEVVEGVVVDAVAGWWLHCWLDGHSLRGCLTREGSQEFISFSKSLTPFSKASTTGILALTICPCQGSVKRHNERAFPSLCSTFAIEELDMLDVELTAFLDVLLSGLLFLRLDRGFHFDPRSHEVVTLIAWASFHKGVFEPIERDDVDGFQKICLLD